MSLSTSLVYYRRLHLIVICKYHKESDYPNTNVRSHRLKTRWWNELKSPTRRYLLKTMLKATTLNCTIYLFFLEDRIILLAIMGVVLSSKHDCQLLLWSKCTLQSIIELITSKKSNQSSVITIIKAKWVEYTIVCKNIGFCIITQ